MHALAVTVPILYHWQTEVRTNTSVWKPHPITEGLGGVVHAGVEISALSKAEKKKEVDCIKQILLLFTSDYNVP